jgi:hypothetical protein
MYRDGGISHAVTVGRNFERLANVMSLARIVAGRVDVSDAAEANHYQMVAETIEKLFMWSDNELDLGFEFWALSCRSQGWHRSIMILVSAYIDSDEEDGYNCYFSELVRTAQGIADGYPQEPDAVDELQSFCILAADEIIDHYYIMHRVEDETN